MTSVQLLSSPFQRTIRRAVSITGFGFWTGEDIQVQFLPAPVNHGISFVRTDIARQPKIPAQIEYRIDKPRQTSLDRHNARVDMVEHLLAAIRGLEIDNLEIRFDGAETPGFDGSALPFAKALLQGEIVVQNQRKKVRVVRKTYQFGDEEKGIKVAPISGTAPRYRYTVDYTKKQDTPLAIPNQSFELDLTFDLFLNEIAPARTFLLQSEANALREMGICRRVSYQDVLVFGPHGVIDNTLRFTNECARHKVLDMIGDFSLSATPIIADISGKRTGHAENAQALKTLLEDIIPEEISEDGIIRIE